MNEEKLTRIDPRSLVPPHLRAAPPEGDQPPPNDVLLLPTDEDEDEPGVFELSLLALAIVFALLAMGRIAWNYLEVRGLDYGVFYPLDRGVSFLQLFALFAIAAGVWRRA
jgi:hypothetical protein